MSAYILSLPTEIQIYILSYLPLPALLSYKQVCIQCSCIAEDSVLWRGQFFVYTQMKSKVPSPRLCATTVMHDDELFMFGGDSGQDQDMYINNIRVWNWELVTIGRLIFL